ncbi:histidinol-phosphate transaminase [Emcibacter sp.]|uniref:pyridoxal phosphate-dependent aminotransferase n=1 Tax=Emcibacter sp. TaxID=1979954 RepID=UPI002AA78503|nr:histidinol-phosphate transaminase [Emcibacter sp.]
MTITPRKGVLDITPYKPGESKIAGVDRIIKLASNESPLGASPKVYDALEQALKKDLALYPDPACTELRQAIGEVHGINPAQILCTNGSEEMLTLLVRAYVGDDDEVILSKYGFLVPPLMTMAAGGTPVLVEEQDYVADIDGMIAAQTARTKMVVLANPNNPTGTYVPFSEIRRLREELRDDILLVLDAAYAEYPETDDYNAGMELVNNGLDNVVVSRTFSKIYGLASLRVGWAYLPPAVMGVLNRIRGTFNVNNLSQIAATAAVMDQDHVVRARTHNNRWLPLMTERLQSMGLKVTPSLGNFVLVHFASAEQAQAADSFLRSQGIIVRPVGNYGLTNSLRISIGRDEESEAALVALKEFMLP